jgi:Protein of unknown function (DUF1116)
MTQPGRTAPSLPGRVGVVNVGLPLFAEAIRQQGAPVISVDWRVPAGGEPGAVAALNRLYGVHAERIEAANAEVLRRLDQASPLLVGVTTVADAVPGLPNRTLLHCGPSIGYAEAPDPLRRSMRAAAVAEGWADSLEHADALLEHDAIRLVPANEHGVVVPMATALGASAPLYVVVNEAGGTTGYAPISQGPGETAWFGRATEASVARLVFLRAVAAPVIGQILDRSGPLDVLSLAAQAVAMGDDVHVRTQAATNLLIREWLPHLTELGPRHAADAAAFARFLGGNHLFFLTLAMAAARSLTAWAAQVPDASIVTTMARNGTTFGIRLAGSDAWSVTAAPEVGHALYYAGQGPQASARDIGDSAVLELCGLGAAAAAGSPAVAQLLGGRLGEAVALTERLAAVCAGRSSRFKIPVLDNAGTPLGVDVRKVVELGMTPAVTTGILHRSAGTGQVGAGVAEAPLACFADALADLDRRLTA